MMNRVRWNILTDRFGVLCCLACLLVASLGAVTPAAAAQGLSFTTLLTFGGSQASTTDLAVGDMNGDGALDIVVVNVDQISFVYLNNGAGRFTTALPFADPNLSPSHVALGDLDGDGDLDMVVGRSMRQATIYRNDGTGRMASSSPLGPTVNATSAIAIADMDGDGALDILLATERQPGTIFFNDGGDFGARTTRWGTSADRPTTLATTDVDGDGALDLVAGGDSQPLQVFRNRGDGTLGDGLTVGAALAATTVVAEDLDGDGDTDIAAASADAPGTVLLNDGAGAFAAHTTFDATRVAALAPADIDNDGDIDLVAGSQGQQNVAMLNDGAAGFGQRIDVGDTGYNTIAVAAADVDGDRSLDIITANFEQTALVYLSDGGTTHQPDQRWGSADDRIVGIATGDVDRDGDLDVVTANGGAQPNQIYRNDGTGTLGEARAFGTDSLDSNNVALADLDGDDDLDIVVGNTAQPNKVYLNDGAGNFPARGIDLGAPGLDTRMVATGDVDGDGDLDVVAGYVGVQDGAATGAGIAPITVFFNDGNASFEGSRTLGFNRTRAIALGDVDGDGDLDIVVGNIAQPSRVYLNDGAGLFGTMRMVGGDTDRLPLQAIALGDVDGDGDLDIVAGSYDRQITIFQNDGAGSFDDGMPFSTGPEKTRALALGDVDNDGDLDIVTANDGQPSRIWRYDRLRSRTFPASARQFFGDANAKTYAVGLGDLDGDGTLDLIAGHSGQPSAVYASRRAERAAVANRLPVVQIDQPIPTGVAGFGSTPRVLATPTITFTYRLSDADSDPVRFIRAQYSTDGGGTWLPAVATSATVTRTLAAAGAGTPHTFVWDTFSSEFFGQSDNVILRIEAFAATTARSGVASDAQQASAAAQTLPFRARGTQVRVMRDNQPVAGALVYHLLANRNRGATPFANALGVPFRTNAQGYLEGSGRIGLNDKLFALEPAGGGRTPLFYTSYQVTTPSLRGFRVTTAGVQTLHIAADRPLLLVPLTVSLEWDARYDSSFMERLKRDLERTSELIFDWTNGQAALGAITIHHDRDAWDTADVRVYATNSLRPNAAQGGISDEPRDDPTATGVGYNPGQVRIGAVWNRFGEASSNLGEDWPRTLAHELGHYVFFLDDDYLGLDDAGVLVPIDTCTSTAMSDPYRDDWSEFRRAGTDWEEQCGDTLANRLTGRADWETIQAFYPALAPGAPNTGPNSLPLAVTTITEVQPLSPTTTLATPLFDLSYQSATYVPGAGARVLLYHDDRITDLGLPNADTVLARGARPGDRLCVYEQPRGRLGCRVLGTGFDTQLPLINRPNWKPELIVTPVTSSTVKLRVSNVAPGLRLSARLFPADDAAPAAQALVEADGDYTTTFQLPQPALEGYVQVWVENDGDQRRESVADYALGGSPGFIRGRGGFIRGRGIDGSSADGQVTLFGAALDDRPGRFFSLQAATMVPNAPTWTSVVGKAYWLHVTNAPPDLSGTSISFGYLGATVPAGEEHGLRIYMYQHGTWRALPTSLDTVHNFASAPAQGPGLYALMSSIDIPLERAGWNLFSYPVQETRPVTDVLRSIEGRYSTVYTYGSTSDNPEMWQLYAPSAPAYVNTLRTFEFGHGYWINVTEPITIQLRGIPASAPLLVGTLADSLPQPPATYYGSLLTDAPVRAGMQLTAYVDGQACGFGRVLDWQGGLAYVVSVRADADGTNGCGAAGRTVTFSVGRFPLPVAQPWQGSGVRELSLASQRSFLPFVSIR